MKAKEFSVVNDAPFTIDEIKKVIPKECFQKSKTLSLYYFIKDCLMIFSLYFVMIAIIEPWMENSNFRELTGSSIVSWLIYGTFWFSMGTLFWSMFVVGHDCGHGSFSDSKSLNYIVGHLAHTPILVPFHSWRISHATHHANTGNIDKDMAFVAIPESYYLSTKYKITWFMRFYFYPFGGWALYLIGADLENTHLWYSSSIFPKGEREHVATSLVLFYSFIAWLFHLGSNYGWTLLVRYYVIPYFVFGAWIAIVTHLHHTHPEVPWYRGDEWNYVRGALGTIDRNYGMIENLHHNIGTHVVHHLFSKIPHYNLLEATEHVKPLLGKHYKKSNESTIGAMARAWKYCRFVDDKENIAFYKS